MVTKEQIIEQLKKVADPHMGVSIIEMGLVREKDIEIDENNNVSFEFMPTSPGCMSVMMMAADAKKVIEDIDGVNSVKINVVGHMMADDLNEILNRDEEEDEKDSENKE